MIVDESANGREVDLSVGETLEVRLPENRTAGYQWVLATEGRPVLTSEGQAYEGAAAPPGRAGQHIWRFRATQPGDATLEFCYRRPWESEAPPTRTFTIHPRVRER